MQANRRVQLSGGQSRVLGPYMWSLPLSPHGSNRNHRSVQHTGMMAPGRDTGTCLACTCF